MTIDVPYQEDVDRFLLPYEPFRIIDPKDPINRFDSEGLHVPYMEKQHEEAIQTTKQVIKQVNDEYYSLFGRKYGDGLIEEIMCEDAEAILVTIGSHTGTARHVVKKFRTEGKKIGIIKIRSFRPFPSEELLEAVKRISPKAIGVCAPQITHGLGHGELYGDIRDTLYDLEKRPVTINFIIGLTGTDVSPIRMEYMMNQVIKAVKKGKAENPVEWGWDIKEKIGHV